MAGSGGFSIDASVRIRGDDRQSVERLIRGHPPQVGRARPPFALERLHAPRGAASLDSPDARLLYRFPKPTPDGRTQILLSPLQLLERLAAFVPPGTDAKRWSSAQEPIPRRARTGHPPKVGVSGCAQLS
jgi:hypothetical protein